MTLKGNFARRRYICVPSKRTSSRLRVFSSKSNENILGGQAKYKPSGSCYRQGKKKTVTSGSYRLTSSRPAGIYLPLAGRPVGFVLTVHFKSRRGSRRRKIEREEPGVYGTVLSNVCRLIKISRNVNASDLIDRGTLSPRSNLGIIISEARLLFLSPSLSLLLTDRCELKRSDEFFSPVSTLEGHRAPDRTVNR